jgi:hypothetical protein
LRRSAKISPGKGQKWFRRGTTRYGKIISTLLGQTIGGIDARKIQPGNSRAIAMQSQQYLDNRRENEKPLFFGYGSALHTDRCKGEEIFDM